MISSRRRYRRSASGRLKGYSARRIKAKLGGSGRVWRREYFDGIIRDDRDLGTVLDYIHHNPVRWGLVEQPADYRGSSAATIYSGREEFREWFRL